LRVFFGYPFHAISESILLSILARLVARPKFPRPPVKILISNDDGYRSDGIRRLAAALAALPNVTVTVMAPERNRSGASNSLTLDVPLRVTQAEPGIYSVAGTPTDCVHLAISGFFDTEHDIVVSGVNDGANLGDDVLYSGTVAAAIEGRFLGLPAIAISLCTSEGGRSHFDTAAQVGAHLVRRLLQSPLDRALILNVNVPDRAYTDLLGYRSTRLGFRHRSEPILPAHDPRGRPVYWVGPAGREQDAGPGTDFNAVAEGYVSVTPLQIDLTRHVVLERLSDWLAQLDD
jgi:5'-nucleotidase